MKTCNGPNPPTVLIRRTKAALHLILNRPEAINSLTLEMLQIITDEIAKAASEKAIKLIIFSGSGTKGFCAGGDIKIMARAVTKNDIEPVMSFLKVENKLDLAIHNFNKPVLVFAHGVTMGGGLGLSAGADIVVADETTRMAMPETRIGFFPDVGATGWLFKKCGKGYPEFLGLTGYELQGSECVRIGLADCLIPSMRLNDALDAVIERSYELLSERKAAAAVLKDILCPFMQMDIPVKKDMDRWIETYFADKTSVLDLLKDLKACSDQNDLCEGVFARISERSPLAVVTTLQCLRRDEHKNLAEVYESDLSVARVLMTQHDFREGVRARLIDKDDQPHWDPESFEQASRLLELQPAMGQL
ncbi:enoyl-coa hydratase [hydrocarbon metagenome]|uniref:3-hydroxyisobutyryl-CoA hydrolase n=1 Tax=hydrocarbon metagenome TaxID=938273 RepID=A0A0W8FN55_9ZZZZ